MTDIELARAIYERDTPTFVIVRDGREIARGNRQGIRELLETLFCLGASAQAASLADKVAGKAVAMTAAFAGICSIYTPLASERALSVCQAHGIELSAAQIIPLVLNASGDGPCPLERTVGPIDQPTAAVYALAEFVHLVMPENLK